MFSVLIFNSNKLNHSNRLSLNSNSNFHFPIDILGDFGILNAFSWIRY